MQLNGRTDSSNSISFFLISSSPALSLLNSSPQRASNNLRRFVVSAGFSEETTSFREKARHILACVDVKTGSSTAYKESELDFDGRA